jgi:predicted secreted hydrolase
VEALLDAQEMALSVRYWEGAVGITGSRDGRAIEGFGYLEMTGYEED